MSVGGLWPSWKIKAEVISERTLKTFCCFFQVWRQSSRKYLNIHLVCLLEVVMTFWMKMRVSSWSMESCFLRQEEGGDGRGYEELPNGQIRGRG